MYYHIDMKPSYIFVDINKSWTKWLWFWWGHHSMDRETKNETKKETDMVVTGQRVGPGGRSWMRAWIIFIWGVNVAWEDCSQWVCYWVGQSCRGCTRHMSEPLGKRALVLHAERATVPLASLPIHILFTFCRAILLGWPGLTALTQYMPLFCPLSRSQINHTTVLVIPILYRQTYDIESL